MELSWPQSLTPVAEARQDSVQVVPLMLHTHNFTSRGSEACTKSPGAVTCVPRHHDSSSLRGEHSGMSPAL